MGVFHELKVWPKFYLRIYCTFCGIVILYRDISRVYGKMVKAYNGIGRGMCKYVLKKCNPDIIFHAGIHDLRYNREPHRWPQTSSEPINNLVLHLNTCLIVGSFDSSDAAW